MIPPLNLCVAPICACATSLDQPLRTNNVMRLTHVPQLLTSNRHHSNCTTHTNSHENQNPCTITKFTNHNQLNSHMKLKLIHLVEMRIIIYSYQRKI